jgi:hypothetical protein
LLSEQARWFILELKTAVAASMFGSVVAVVFQIAFRVKIHANDIFLFFKNYFLHQHIKMI